MDHAAAHATPDRPRTLRAAAAVVAALTLGACASNGAESPAPRSTYDPGYDSGYGAAPQIGRAEDLVAQDLVFALAQLPELHPMRTTIQLGEPAGAFGRALVARLSDAGYSQQRVSSDQGRHYLRYDTDRAVSESGPLATYSVGIGDVGIVRDYVLDNGSPVPVSSALITGAEPTTLASNDDIFGTPVPAQLREPVFDYAGDAQGSEPIVEELTLTAAEPAPRYQDRSTRSAAPEESLVEDPAGPTPAPGSRRFGSAVKQNLYDAQASNYSDVFVDYTDVRAMTLVFPSDSLALGESNKRAVQAMVRQLDPNTDVVSIIGCSHGGSRIANGNEVLAIGRANRVKEAFVFAGVAHDQVLEESCWAGQAHETLPARGVVVTLKRRRG